MDEREAIERLKRGDIGGLEELVRGHQVQAVRAAFLVTRDLSTAEDVVQAAFVKAYERITQFDPSRPFAPWFLRSVLRDATKAAARRDRHTPLDGLAGHDEPTPGLEALTDPDAGPETRWERAETADEVWRALGELRPNQRAAIVSRYFLDLTEAELSRTFRLPRSTVKWRLHAARQRLRLLLQPASIE